jgi:hypothetical protein
VNGLFARWVLGGCIKKVPRVGDKFENEKYSGKAEDLRIDASLYG